MKWQKVFGAFLITPFIVFVFTIAAYFACLLFGLAKPFNGELMAMTCMTGAAFVSTAVPAFFGMILLGGEEVQ